MRRREFIGLLGSASRPPHFWPFSADAQQGERVRLIGVLLQATKNDLESEARVKAFLHGLEQLGWTEGRNLKLEYRWAGGNSDDIRKHAAELVAPRAGYPRGGWKRNSRGSAAGDAYCTDRVCDCWRSGRWRLCRKLSAAGWQHHRVCDL